ncbi:hypothetical protein VTN77DRAFT_4500 [Rasamsonia byssochlamydoides]|uniref:uncharacterized protein n=1 Tax=Rasamsonia byssochlamydoides TaxID=89139 RepID=UPI003743D685
MFAATDRNNMLSDPESPSKGTTLLDLPAEILHQILSYLSATDLACVSSTCRTLSEHGNSDLLWADLVNANLPVKIKDPGPFDSFRSLYSAHHPYWFVPRNKIWFSDEEHTGKLILARYDNRRGVIEGFRLVAEKGPEHIEQWEWDPTVLMETFTPKVRLWLDDPVLLLENPTCAPPRQRPYLDREFRMPMAAESQGIYSSFLLCYGNVPENHPAVQKKQVWPPVTIPSENRVYCSRRGNGPGEQWDNQPDLGPVSESAFRVRKWARFQMDLPIFPAGTQANLATFATLDPALYTPTKEKPYQGIWVGDYSFHGCEFLLFVQRDKEATESGPESDQFPAGSPSASSSLEDGNEGGDSLPQESLTASGSNDVGNDTSNDDKVGEQGRLEGIKLTGDPNVPRGEISFVAEDIGPDGLIRVAEEKNFRGARIVRSKGHIASRNFRHDQFIDAQLILISHDCIAQFWEAMNHISFFRRVDIDKLLQS